CTSASTAPPGRSTQGRQPPSPCTAGSCSTPSPSPECFGLPALEHAFADRTRLQPCSNPATVFQRGPRPSARPRPRILEMADLAMWTSWETGVTAHILTTGETSHGYCFPRGLHGDDRSGKGA